MAIRTIVARAILVAALCGSASAYVPGLQGSAFAASEISVVVNRQPITTYQIRQRAAFLKLRREGGNTTQKAKDELIDEALKTQETRRLGIKIPDEQVNQAFAKFASDNKLTEAQLSQVLSRAGFSADAFKDYIRVQMGWGQAVQARVRSKEKLSEQDVVQRMLAQGGKKPSTTEYTLQQVIFVIPDGQRSAMLGNRRREANSMRSRFQSCGSTFDIAKSLRDVTVRDLGRVAKPELPPKWKDDIVHTSVGRTTPVQDTERGVEFIAVCDSRSISDDKVAAMVFQSRDLEKIGKEEEPDADFLKTLKDRAQIVRR